MRRLALLLTAFLPGLASIAEAQAPVPEVSSEEPENVYLLSVRINGWPLGLVARFGESGGRLWLPAEQFEGIGFRPDPSLVTVIDDQRRVYLDALPGVAWEVDQGAQTIDITTPFALLQPNMLRVAPGVARVESRSNWGALLAYELYGEYANRARSDVYSRVFSVNAEARLFSPWFMASTSGYYSIAEGQDAGEVIRLESRIDFDDVDRATRLRIGDSFTFGPIWLRSVRFGGVQWSREFSLRPDIVTTPIPELSQDVSVPSTVDVFVNEVQRFSRAVDPGAVRITDLPVVTGANEVRVVVTDQSGRRVTLYLPLYASTELLAPGMSDFNFEAGVERLNYASRSNDYGEAFASGRFSHGVTDRLTLTGYGAAADNYWTAAAGATASIGRLLLLDVAAMYSDGPDGDGWSLYGSAEHISGPFTAFASYMHSSRGFRDLAANFGYTSYTDQATASAGLNLGDYGQLNASWVMQRALDGDRTSLVTGTYGLDLFRRQVHLSFSAYKEMEEDDWGAVVSISFPLGRAGNVYAEHSWRNGVLSSAATLNGETGDSRLRWQLAGEQGEFEEVSAGFAIDTERVDIRGQVAASNDDYVVRGEFAQTLVLIGDRPIIAGRIDDGFAIVDVAEMPGVRVALENRPVGRTNRRGRLFVTGLDSYSANALSIDATDLPIDASLADPALIASPREGGGLVVYFPVTRESSALVILLRPDGTPPPVGAEVAVEGSEIASVVGFEGEVFVRGLQAGTNRLEVSWRDGRCSVTFTAESTLGRLPRLGPFTCAS